MTGLLQQCCHLMEMGIFVYKQKFPPHQPPSDFQEYEFFKCLTALTLSLFLQDKLLNCIPIFTFATGVNMLTKASMPELYM